MNSLKIFTICLQLSLSLAITPDKVTRDSYISAYMESQSPSDLPAGVVYPEPARLYGSPQHKPPVYYGPPVNHAGPPMEFINPIPSFFEIMMHLPEKLEFLPKIASVLLTVTKIMLKVVLLKIILKFVFMFCLFFFLPKLEMFDMMTSLESTTMSSHHNSTHSVMPDEDQEDMRLNNMSSFVWDSINTQSYLQKYCTEGERSQKCKFLRTLSKMEKVVSIPKLFNVMWTTTLNKFQNKSTE